MRLLLQRVKNASVTIDGALYSSIQSGLLILLGIHKDDRFEDIEKWVTKVANLRIFSDAEGKMNHSVKDSGGEVLIVSQFTLYGRCEKGRRPDFLESAPPAHAIPLYEAFIERFKQEGLVVKNGVFGAHMEVDLLNDGPVTLLLE
jgi:D-tyrosyl-tRNA(Tyr) deacylase